MLSEKARGLWADILGELAPELMPAIEAGADHVPCPVHGGKDGFRVFNDFQETGGGVCNTSGRSETRAGSRSPAAGSPA